MIPKTPKRKKKKREGMSKTHLKNIRQLPCVVCNVTPSQAHHLKQDIPASERGMSRKASDQWAVPLCEEHHMQGVELIGSKKETAWFRAQGVNDAPQYATALWSGRHSLEVMWNIAETYRTTGKAVEV